MNKQAIFITGVGSGIGLATAKKFHDEGWIVGGCDSQAASLDSLSEELEDGFYPFTCDVRDKSLLEAALADFYAKAGGRLDVMFNNAGIATGGFFEEVPFERTLDMVNINLVGVLNGFYAAIPYLKETPGSLCITTSSSAAIFGAAGMATYTATKYAIKGFTHAMSVELARFDVRVADVMPGIIDTPLWFGDRYRDGRRVGNYEKIPKLNASRTDSQRTIPPKEVAATVWSAYFGDRLHWYVPSELEENDKVTSADYEKRRNEILEARKEQ
jgi:NAD(P)-dependent dehydrogenase (short-subunit alcohol dehydrogenase family)